VRLRMRTNKLFIHITMYKSKVEDSFKMSTAMHPNGEETKTMECNDCLPEWVNALPTGANRDYWPPRAKDHPINWEIPTNEVYHDPTFSDYTEEFKEARRKLDYSYHRNPAKSRQELQDVILKRVVQAARNANELPSQNEEEEKEQDNYQRRPWIVFSAGPMGVGKGYVMSTLKERGLFPLDRFLTIDPDLLKAELPEMTGYLQRDPASAATKVHRESTQMADVLLQHALQMRIPTLVDGSLRDVDYYKAFMERIRNNFPEYQLAILHVTASPEIIRSRAQSRAEKTGRAVPEQLLETSIAQVPASVTALSPFVDVVFTISNEEDQPIRLVGNQAAKGSKRTDSITLSWKEFRDTWWTTLPTDGQEKKVCAFMPEWCDKQCPGISQVATCWWNKECLKSAKAAFGLAYPSFCPGCTLSGGVCGVCVHDVHFCRCTKCNKACPLLTKAQTFLSSGVNENVCPLSGLKEKS
jgi:Zeta toxin